MPIDARGNHAMWIMDGASTTKRTNLGRFYEHAYNAFGREVTETLRSWMGLDIKNPQKADIIVAMQKTAIVDSCYDYLMDFYGTISPLMREALEENNVSRATIVSHCLEHGHYIAIPTHNPKESPQILRDLRAKFPLTVGPVTYRGQSGNMVTTIDPVIVSSMYLMLLDKTGADWAAVSSAKLQVYGTPSKLTNSDKYANMGRPTPTRVWGEAECRLDAAYVGGDATAEKLDRSNNPVVHKHISRNIYEAEKPSNIVNIVNRKDIPKGSGRPISFTKHMVSCAGATFAR